VCENITPAPPCAGRRQAAVNSLDRAAACGIIGRALCDREEIATPDSHEIHDVSKDTTRRIRDLRHPRGSTMATGSVKWFNESKGIGTITEDFGEDISVHYSAIEGSGFKTLALGERVEFELTRGPRGASAARVRRLI
jgi:CspA family cold shock protein